MPELRSSKHIMIQTILLAHAAGFTMDQILESNAWKLNESEEMYNFLKMVYA